MNRAHWNGTGILSVVPMVVSLYLLALDLSRRLVFNAVGDMGLVTLALLTAIFCFREARWH